MGRPGGSLVGVCCWHAFAAASLAGERLCIHREQNPEGLFLLAQEREMDHTLLLQAETLNGTFRATMLATVSPLERDFSYTHDTLKCVRLLFRLSPQYRRSPISSPRHTLLLSIALPERRTG